MLLDMGAYDVLWLSILSIKTCYLSLANESPHIQRLLKCKYFKLSFKIFSFIFSKCFQGKSREYSDKVFGFEIIDGKQCSKQI